MITVYCVWAWLYQLHSESFTTCQWQTITMKSLSNWHVGSIVHGTASWVCSTPVACPPITWVSLGSEHSSWSWLLALQPACNLCCVQNHNESDSVKVSLRERQILIKILGDVDECTLTNSKLEFESLIAAQILLLVISVNVLLFD